MKLDTLTKLACVGLLSLGLGAPIGANAQSGITE
jgi:hypothetical protein